MRQYDIKSFKLVTDINYFYGDIMDSSKQLEKLQAQLNALKIFPKNILVKQLQQQIVNKIKKLDSRHITIVRTYPMILLYDKGAFVLNSLE